MQRALKPHFRLLVIDTVYDFAVALAARPGRTVRALAVFWESLRGDEGIVLRAI